MSETVNKFVERLRQLVAPDFVCLLEHEELLVCIETKIKGRLFAWSYYCDCLRHTSDMESVASQIAARWLRQVQAAKQALQAAEAGEG